MVTMLVMLDIVLVREMTSAFILIKVVVTWRDDPESDPTCQMTR
jgi:hypothetical protein